MSEHDDPPAEELQQGNASKDDCTMAMLCHLCGIMGFLIPLIIWLIKKDQSKYIDYHGKEAINFHLTMLIGHLIAGATICFTFGVLSIAIWGLSVTFSIIACLAANRGEWYRYPMSIRFIT